MSAVKELIGVLLTARTQLDRIHVPAMVAISSIVMDTPVEVRHNVMQIIRIEIMAVIILACYYHNHRC